MTDTSEETKPPDAGRQPGLAGLVAPAAVAAFTLGLAPFVPEPHVVEKLRWVLGGAEGMRLIDWFDLLMHGAPWIWLAAALVARLRAG